MRKSYRIPTLLALFLLLGGLVGGVFLIKRGIKFSSGAKVEIKPQQVRISNIGERSFTVSWVTDEKTTGFVQYGPTEELMFTAYDDRDQISGQQGKFWTHHVTIKGLSPATDYFFKINSEGQTFDNNGRPYSVKTAPLLGEALPNDVAYGTVVKQDNSPAEGVIVYLSLANASLLSTMTKSSGNWAIPLNMARTSDLSSWAKYDKDASIEEIFVQGGPDGTATAIVLTRNDSPVPSITLGNNFDFRESPPQATPTEPPVSSKFEVKENILPSYELRIINPSSGEEINTLRPEIIGAGPPGEVVDIKVESPKVLTGKVKIGGDGNWRWLVPEELSPGQHTITVSLANGQKITRTFTVLAVGESNLPSFTASPSATLTPISTPTPTQILTFIPTSTPTPTPTLTLTPTPTPTIGGRIIIPSTEGGIPKSGSLTPTFLFSTMGAGLIFLGMFLLRIKKYDAGESARKR